MAYTADETFLAGHYRGGITEGAVPGRDITVTSEEFCSCGGYSLPAERGLKGVFSGFFRGGELSTVNNKFRYYIVKPENAGKGAIILLHGLNERSWNKYLQWAFRLATDTGRPVILFPIAYHMNRSPRSWADRHAVMAAVTARSAEEPGARLVSFVNVALSTRMSLTPERFLYSGYQTVVDVGDLIRSIRNGKVHGVSSDGPVDIFAYSIGAMLAQVLMLSRSNPLGDNARIFLFSGGSTLGLMNGTSKLILDSNAFDRLIDFYIRGLEEGEGKQNRRLMGILNDTPHGEAFFAMSSIGRLKDHFGAPFRGIDGRLKAITFSTDTVIPAAAVSDTLFGADVEIWSPDFPSIHENPFPVLQGERAWSVDSTFDRLFCTAARFFE